MSKSLPFLAELAADIPLVFLSTDLVFDGRTGNYDEAAPVNPLSVYAGNESHSGTGCTGQSEAHGHPHVAEWRHLSYGRPRIQ